MTRRGRTKDEQIIHTANRLEALLVELEFHLEAMEREELEHDSGEEEREPT